MTRWRRVSRIVAKGTRVWIYCPPGGATALDAGADPSQALNADGLEGIAIKSNKDFQAAYIKAGGSNATFQVPRRATTLGRTGPRSCRPSNQT